MEVRALYRHLSCVHVVCAWRTCLRWEVGGVVACHAAVLNRQWHPMGAFSMGVRIDGGLSQQPVCVDCGLSYTTVQATITRLWLVYYWNWSTRCVIAKVQRSPNFM